MSEPWIDPAHGPPAGTRATVVFVHGAIVRGWEMALLRRRLRQLGYHVRQFRYRSMMIGLDENARRLKEFLSQTEGDILHVIGHSMGGVLIRRVFEHDPDPRPGRLIAIGSPLLDCWIGRRFDRLLPLFGRLMIGRTVADHILSPSDSVWKGTRDFGVLAGTYPIGVGSFFNSLPGPSDGTVLLDETKLEGIRDHSAIRLNHFSMLFSRRCCVQIARFLATGTFGQAMVNGSATDYTMEPVGEKISANAASENGRV